MRAVVAAGGGGTSAAMDEQQREHFQTHGWLLLEDAIGLDLVAELNAAYQPHLVADWDGVSLAHGWRNGGMVRPAEERFAGRALWGAPFYQLIDPPAVVAVLEELLGDPRFEHVLPGTPAEHARKINMDHDNTHFTAPFDPVNKEGFVGKQGGAATFNQTETWTPGGLCRGGIHGGGRLNHMITVVYELLPVQPGTGGTACLSGTHRTGARSGTGEPFTLSSCCLSFLRTPHRAPIHYKSLQLSDAAGRSRCQRPELTSMAGGFRGRAGDGTARPGIALLGEHAAQHLPVRPHHTLLHARCTRRLQWLVTHDWRRFSLRLSIHCAGGPAKTNAERSSTNTTLMVGTAARALTRSSTTSTSRFVLMPALRCQHCNMGRTPCLR